MAKSPAIIYARYSSDKQTEQSIEGQVRVCTDFADHNNYEIINSYFDRAKTATTDNRPAFQQMIRDAAKGEFRYIIVYKLDRFARNRYDSAHYKHILKKYGVRVISATELITDSPESILTEAMLEGMAEFFSVELAQKTKRGMRETAMKCNSTGHIPLGYKVVNKKLEIDDSTAEIPRIAFEMYSSGKSKKYIADYLNNKGYRTRRGQLFKVSSFDNMFKNKKYIGVYTYTDVVIEDGCPALIDKDLFKKVQSMIEKNKNAPASGKAKIDYLLSGKIFCGYCGSPMIGESGKSHSGAVYNYYACRSRKKEHACQKKNERQDFIEWYICEQTLELLKISERKSMLADKIIYAYKKSFGTSGVEDLEKRLTTAKLKQKKIAEAISETGGKRILYEQLDELEAQECDIEEELIAARIAARHIPTRDEIEKWFDSLNNLDISNPEVREYIISVFVNRVFLYDDKLTIFYNMKNTENTVTFEQIREFESCESCSDLNSLGVPNIDLSELILINCVFGVHLKRKTSSAN